MSNSSLVCYTKLSPNHSGKRTHSIDRITPHCVVGQLSCETICACFPEGRGQAVIMVSVQMVEFPFVLMKVTVLGVLHPMQTISGRLLSNVHLIKLNRMQ